jgi:preprotein translocase subunit SecB
LRETLDSLLVKGGFPAVQLAPINFDALYSEAMKSKADSVSGPNGPVGPKTTTH